MYYMRFINDNGSSEEIELQRGDIFCKCHVCGQEFAPYRIEFNRQFDSEAESFFWNTCPDCAEKRKAESSSQEEELAHIKLAKELSRVFKKEITPADIQQFLNDNKGTGADIWNAAHDRFGNGQPFVLGRKEPHKSKIAQQAKSITIIPRHEHR